MSETYFEYFFSSKDGMTIITLVGEIDDKSFSVIDDCISNLSNSVDMKGILYMRDVSNISDNSFQKLKELLLKCREKFSENFAICSLKPTLRITLTNNDLAKSDEFTNNLKETAIHFLKKD